VASIDRMSLLELLRKSGSDGDVDFLKEALNVLVHSLMEGVAYPGRHARSEHSEASQRQLFSLPA
jgi:hypothetical protein